MVIMVVLLRGRLVGYVDASSGVGTGNVTWRLVLWYLWLLDHGDEQQCQPVWWKGVRHDRAAVMELVVAGDVLLIRQVRLWLMSTVWSDLWSHHVTSIGL